MAQGGEHEGVTAATTDGRLGDLALSGVGRLSDVIGAEKAHEFFTVLEGTRKFLYTRAVNRWGNPRGHHVRAGAYKARSK